MASGMTVVMDISGGEESESTDDGLLDPPMFIRVGSGMERDENIVREAEVGKANDMEDALSMWEDFIGGKWREGVVMPRSFVEVFFLLLEGGEWCVYLCLGRREYRGMLMRVEEYVCVRAKVSGKEREGDEAGEDWGDFEEAEGTVNPGDPSSSTLNGEERLELEEEGTYAGALAPAPNSVVGTARGQGQHEMDLEEGSGKSIEAMAARVRAGLTEEERYFLGTLACALLDVHSEDIRTAAFSTGKQNTLLLAQPYAQLQPTSPPDPFHPIPIPTCRTRKVVASLSSWLAQTAHHIATSFSPFNPSMRGTTTTTAIITSKSLPN